MSYQDDVALVLEAMGMIAGVLTETGERCWIVPDGPVIDIDANFIVERVIPWAVRKVEYPLTVTFFDDCIEAYWFDDTDPSRATTMHEAVMAAIAAALRAWQ